MDKRVEFWDFSFVSVCFWSKKKGSSQLSEIVLLGSVEWSFLIFPVPNNGNFFFFSFFSIIFSASKQVIYIFFCFFRCYCLNCTFTLKVVIYSVRWGWVLLLLSLGFLCLVMNVNYLCLSCLPWIPGWYEHGHLYFQFGWNFNFFCSHPWLQFHGNYTFYLFFIAVYFSPISLSWFWVDRISISWCSNSTRGCQARHGQRWEARHGLPPMRKTLVSVLKQSSKQLSRKGTFGSDFDRC